MGLLTQISCIWDKDQLPYGIIGHLIHYVRGLLRLVRRSSISSVMLIAPGKEWSVMWGETRNYANPFVLLIHIKLHMVGLLAALNCVQEALIKLIIGKISPVPIEEICLSELSLLDSYAGWSVVKVIFCRHR